MVVVLVTWVVSVTALPRGTVVGAALADVVKDRCGAGVAVRVAVGGSAVGVLVAGRGVAVRVAVAVAAAVAVATAVAVAVAVAGIGAGRRRGGADRHGAGRAVPRAQALPPGLKIPIMTVYEPAAVPGTVQSMLNVRAWPAPNDWLSQAC